METTRDLHFDDLPNELLHYILEYLDTPDLNAVCFAS